jgi:hypothetical protein
LQLCRSVRKESDTCGVVAQLIKLCDEEALQSIVPKLFPLCYLKYCGKRAVVSIPQD